MADYDAGKVFLQVVPSFRDVHRIIGREVKSWGAEAGKQWQEGFDREATRGFERSSKTVGPSASDAGKSGSEAGGAFADQFKRRLDAALKALGPIKPLPVETGSIDAQVRSIQRRLESLRANIDADMDAGEVLAQIENLRGRLERLDRDDVDIQVRVDAASAMAQLAAVQTMVNNLDGDDVRFNVSTTGLANLNSFVGRVQAAALGLMSIGPAVLPVLGAAAVGVAALGTAATVGAAGLGTLAVGLHGVGDAVKALREVEVNAAQDAEQAAERRASAARSIASAQRQLENAERGLANARRNAGEQAEDAARRVVDAQRQAGAATRDAARNVAQALRRQEDAEKRLADTQEATRQAQLDLTQARKDAQDILDDLSRSTRGAALAEEDAELGLARARERLAEAMAEGVVGLDLQEADLAVRQAELRLEEARDRNQEVHEEALAASTAGVDGAENVLAAEQRLAEARDRETSAQRDAADAALAVTEARVQGAERIAAANEAVTRALEAQSRQQQDSAASIAGAVASVEGAQAALAAAVESSNEEMSTSARNAKEAMDQLSPAGQAFATFIAASVIPGLLDMRDAVQAALLPDIEQAMRNLAPMQGAMTTFLVSMADALGDLAIRASEALAGPEWQEFFAFLAAVGPEAFTTLAEAAGNFITGLANLLVDLGPMMLDVIGWIGDAAAAFREWSQGTDGESPLQGFMDFMRENGPHLLALFKSIGGAVAALVRSMMPFAPVVLRIATAFFNMIAALPPEVISTIVLSLIGLLAVIQSLSIAFTIYRQLKLLSDALRGMGAVLSAGVLGVLLLVAAALVALYFHNEDFRNIVDTTFRAIADVVGWAWDNVIQPIFAALTWFVTEVLGPAFLWLWHNVLEPAFDAFGRIISFYWTYYARPVFQLITAYLTEVLGPAFMWLWREVVEPVWDGIQSAAGATWRWLSRNVFDPFMDAINALGDLFGAIGGIIGDAWGAIQDIIRVPINWVLEHVINGGIINAYNWIAEHVPGIDEIQPLGLIDPPPVRSSGGGRFAANPAGTRFFASGGIYPGYTPGRDIGFIGVSGGEAIMRPEWTRAIGAEAVHAMNAIARTQGVAGVRRYLGGHHEGGILPRYANGPVLGGLVDLAKEGWEGAKNLGSDIKGAFEDFVIGQLRKASEALINPLLNQIEEHFPGGGMVRDMVVGVARRLAEGLFGFAEDQDETGELGGGPFALNRRGWPPAIAGRVAANTLAAVNWVRETFGINNIGTLGNRPNRSDHPIGKALDVMIANWQDPAGIALGNRIASAFVMSPEMFGTKYVIWRDQINSGSGWRRYTHPSGNTTNPTLRHMDHVHVSLFDRGGRLQPGLSAVMNGTGRSELVLTNDQEGALAAAIRELVRGGAASQPLVGVLQVGSADDARKMTRELEIQQEMARYRMVR